MSPADQKAIFRSAVPNFFHLIWGTDLTVTIDAENVLGLCQADPLANGLPVTTAPRHGVINHRESEFQVSNQFLRAISAAILTNHENMFQTGNALKARIPH